MRSAKELLQLQQISMQDLMSKVAEKKILEYGKACMREVGLKCAKIAMSKDYYDTSKEIIDLVYKIDSQETEPTPTNDTIAPYL